MALHAIVLFVDKVPLYASFVHDRHIMRVQDYSESTDRSVMVAVERLLHYIERERMETFHQCYENFMFTLNGVGQKTCNGLVSFAHRSGVIEAIKSWNNKMNFGSDGIKFIKITSNVPRPFNFSL
ncbi:hypothetical protein V6N12_048877 [Hibiscus sabdariffa]|uniref:Uncharacterized protein n=1 Tax=Hibiscus sabdariffa TaxID=183260 RepID=A0ABR2EIJ4_9ROSI